MLHKFLFVSLIFTSSFDFVPLQSTAQKIEHYLDEELGVCKPEFATYYTVKQHQPSGLWERNDYYIKFFRERQLIMHGYYSDSSENSKMSLFKYFDINGKLLATGNYTGNKKEGQWLEYYPDGSLKQSATYKNDSLLGPWVKRYPWGAACDSMFKKNDGTYYLMSFDRYGKVSMEGKLNDYQFDGEWLFYHTGGNVSEKATYNKGTLMNHVYFDEKNNLIGDTTFHDKDAVFGKKPTDWVDYLLKQTYSYQRVTEEARVVADFVITEEGFISDIHIVYASNAEVGESVSKALKFTEQWQPAVNHGRKVDQYCRQSIYIPFKEKMSVLRAALLIATPLPLSTSLKIGVLAARSAWVASNYRTRNGIKSQGISPLEIRKP
jgi:antitoxin component YwqK of YwqJK toxin-antitoxin module